LSWHIESVCRLVKERGGRCILVRFISFMKKLEVLHTPRNLAGTKMRTEQDYGAKVGEISRLIPYLKDSRQQRNASYFQKDKLVIWNFYKKITRYRTPTKHQITL
jgi:hypothetical protein